jgi:hypothetical protein
MPGDLAPDNRNLRVSHEDRDHVAERLRVAAGDGRLTAQELDERLEAALTARTYGELEVLLSDLPAVPGALPGSVPEAKELIELRIEHGTIRRDGSWVVPRRLVAETRHGNVSLDFTQAVISHPALDLVLEAGHGTVVLIVGPEVAVDVDSVATGHSTIRQHQRREPGTPVRLVITVSGSLRHSTLTVRGPRAPRGRCTFWEWLLRRRSRAALEPGGRGRA